MTNSKWSLATKASSLALVVAMSGAFGSTAIAQTDEASAENDDTIVVTARRQNETLLEVPVAVSAFDEEGIEDLGLRTIDDIARNTAGLSFSQAFGRTTERPVIRGSANILAGVQFGVESGTAYFLDGVYYSGDLLALDTKNLQRVEVIKGPQSALYGRNTYAGAINYITRLPSKNGREFTIEGTAAEDGEFELYGRASNSFADDTFGVSLSARTYQYDGDSFWINQTDGTQLGSEETFSLNLVADYDPSDAVSVVGRLGYVEDQDGPRPFALIGAEQNNCFPGYRSGQFYNPNHLAFLSPPFAGIFPDTTTTDNNFQYFCGELSQFDDLRPAQDRDSIPFLGIEREMLFGTLKADFDLGNDYLLSVQGGFRDEDRKTGADSDHQAGESIFPATGDFVFPISPFFSVTQADGNFSNAAISEVKDHSFEVRLQSPAENRLRWSLGAFTYDYDQDDFVISFANPAPSFVGPLDETEGIENQAIFGTLSYDLTEALELSFEARYQEETKSLTQFDAAGATTFAADAEFNDFLPKVIVNYNPAPDTTFYASFAQGLKPGGINGPDGEEVNQVEYLPEEKDSFEIGYKTRYADDRGILKVAAYYDDVTNYQLTTPIASGGVVNSVATNQGNAEVLGLEIETQFAVSDSFDVGATYAYTDAEFTEGCDAFQFTLTSGGFIMAPITIGDESTYNLFVNPADPASPLTAPASDPNGLFTGAGDCSIEGNQVPMTSEHQFSAFGRYEAPIGGDWNFFANANYTFESSKFIQVHNGIETGDVGILGAQVGLRKDDLRLELFARNLTDDRTPPIATRWFDVYEGFATLSSADREVIDNSIIGPRSTFLSYRRGRQIGVRATLDF